MASDADVSGNRSDHASNVGLGDAPDLISEMRRMLRVEMTAVHDRIDRIQTTIQERTIAPPLAEAQGNNEGRRRDHPRQERGEEEDDYYSQGGRSTNRSHRRPRHVREGRNHQEDNVGGMKLKIPPFYGKSDPDLYLEWEKKIELVFDCQTCADHKKVQLAATEFYDYAISWWDQIVTTRRRNREPRVETWREMKNLMRKRFVPSHYHRELHQRLRRLTQGSKCVEDYFQEMESLMLKADIDEEAEATMARFLSGLSRDIQDRMELQTYDSLEEMLHKAVLVEQQVKRKSNVRTSYGAGASNARANYQREDRSVVKPLPGLKANTPSPDTKGKAEATSTRNRDVKCFKCQGRGHYAYECTNKRIMVLLENGDIETEDEEEQDQVSVEEQVELPAVGTLLVARRALSVQPKITEQEQRENLFHTRCIIVGKVCSLIIDGGSCTNVASETMVKKLGLTVIAHPKPYKLQWLNEAGEMLVNNQVLVSLSIGNYKDEILCDILPMEAGHILLGRPWQFDRRVLQDGFTN